jgi:hypothetical protein
MHSRAAFAPIKRIGVPHLVSPEPIKVRISNKRRKNVMAVDALEDVNLELVENGPMPKASAEQTTLHRP